MANRSTRSTDVKILLSAVATLVVVIIAGYAGLTLLGSNLGSAQQDAAQTQPTLPVYEPPADLEGAEPVATEASTDVAARPDSAQPAAEETLPPETGAEGRPGSGRDGRLPSDGAFTPGARLTAIAQGTPLPGGQFPGAADGSMAPDARLTAIAQGTFMPGQRTPGEIGIAETPGALAPAAPDATAAPVATPSQGDVVSSPPAAGLFAVARGAGADLYDRPEGDAITDLAPGSPVSAVARSDDGQWILAQSDDTAGWIPAEQLVLFDAASLPVITEVETSGDRPATELPATRPTDIPVGPTQQPAEQPTVRPTERPAAQFTERPTELQLATAEPVLPPPTSTPAADVAAPPQLGYIEPVMATVASEDARLNVRTGPGTAYDLLEKVDPGAEFVALARSEFGDWIQIALPETVEGSGWVATEFLNLSGPVESLFVSEITDPAPALPTPHTPEAPITAPGGYTEQVMATVASEDALLNVRTGPGADYAILRKLDPGEQYVALNRSADGDWIQIALPDTVSGSGWVAAEFVDLSASLESLPVFDADEPATGDDDSAAASVTPAAAAPASDDTEPVALGPPKYLPVVGAVPAANSDPVAAELGGTLVFEASNGGQIYAYDLDTGALWPITTGFDPAISPDGGTVAFTRDGGEHGLYLIDITGNNERLIFSGGQRLASPKWSPGGDWIVFSRGDDAYQCISMGRGGCTPVGDMDDRPLPDDALLSTWVNYHLSVVDANGDNYHDLATLESARAPDWNEVGIVYQSDAGLQRTADEPNAENQLILFDYLKPYFHDPDWQPGGGKIAYQGKEASHWEIFTVNPDGSGVTPLTRPKTALVHELPSNVAPAWSPDGSAIVFLSNRTDSGEAGDWRLWVMDGDGGNQRPLPIDIPIIYTFGDEQVVSWGASATSTLQALDS